MSGAGARASNLARAATSGIDPGWAEQSARLVYALLTLLGVVSAASWKNRIAGDDLELAAMILGTAVSIAVAHAWATVMAHRVVNGSRLTVAEVREEFGHAWPFLVAAAVPLGVLLVARLGSDNYDSAVDLAQAAMVLAVLGVGLVGSRRAGASWPRALLWGLADAAVGLAMVALKIFSGG